MSIQWKEFDKKALAKAAMGPGDSLFGMDVHRSGAKKFIVTTKSVFIERYLAMNPAQRMANEIVPDDQPIKLYMDIEVYLKENPDLDVTVIVPLVIQTVQEITNLPILPFILDASNGEKFSQHLIFPVVFPHKADMKAFMLHLIDCLVEKNAPIPKDKMACGMDTSVYNREGHFRMYGSHKMSQPARKLYPVIDGVKQTIINEEWLKQSMITWITEDTSLTRYNFDSAATSGKKRARTTVASSSAFLVSASSSRKASKTEPEYPEIEAEVDTFLRDQCPLIKNQGKFARRHPVYVYSNEYQVKFTLISKGNPRPLICRAKGAAHESNTLFFHLNVTTGYGHFSCTDPDCIQAKKSVWGKAIYYVYSSL